MSRNRIISGNNFIMCPICGGKATGKVGVERFYCWDCCVEYRINNDGVQIFRLSEDGSLIALDAPLATV